MVQFMAHYAAMRPSQSELTWGSVELCKVKKKICLRTRSELVPSCIYTESSDWINALI